MKLWKRKRKIDPSSILQVPLAVLIREVIYDTMLTPTEQIAVAMGLPPISTIGFGRRFVSSDKRVPSPPARMTAFIKSCLKVQRMKEE